MKKKVKLGRKKAEDPKVAVIFYILQSVVDKVGGKPAARDIAINACKKHKPETQAQKLIKLIVKNKNNGKSKLC